MNHLSNHFSIFILIGRLITMMASFAMPLILVRCMSQSDYGVFSQFFTLYSAVYVILAFGLHSSLFYFYPSASTKERNGLISNTFFFLFVLGIIGGIVMFCPFISHLIFGDSELSHYKEWILLCIAFATPMNIVSPLNTVRADKWGAMIIPGLVSITRIATVIFCVMIYNDMYILFKWLFFFQLCVFIAVGYYSLKQIKIQIDFSLLKRQIVYSLPFGFAVALQLLSNYFDKFVCINFLSPADFAIYGVAFFSIPGVTQVYDSLCQVNIVNMSKSYRDGDIDMIVPQYGNFVVKTLSFSTPLIIAVAVFAEEIISFLYTESYVEAATYFRLYSLTFLTSMFGAGTVLRSMGRTKQSLWAFLITSLVGLPVTYFLVKNQGTNGAIIGAMINMILPRIIQLFMESKALKISLYKFLPWKTILQIIGGALLFSIPMLFIKKLLIPNLYVIIVICALYILCTYYWYLKCNMFIIDYSYIKAIIRKKK